MPNDKLWEFMEFFALITFFVLLVILLIGLAVGISMLIGEYKKWKRKEKNGENDFDA